MTADELNAIIEAAKKTGAKVEVLGLPPHLIDAINGDDGNERMKHKLSAAAQEANLISAWADYNKPARFEPGDILREKPGLTTFNDNPVILFVRYLETPEGVVTFNDQMLIRGFLGQRPGNKVDCVIARTSDEGTTYFGPHDSGLLTPYVPA